ncbi:MAG: sarcosine oxidase subunit gamma [Wenzhouxiangellaceae bacterium]
MPEITATSHSILEPALAELTARNRSAANRADPLRLVEAPPTAKVIVRALEPLEALNHVLEPILSTRLDDCPNKVSIGKDCRVFWLRVNQWLVIAEPGRSNGLVHSLEQALTGFDSSVVDVSDYYTVLELSGPGARDVVMKGCPFDLHPRAFPTGAMALTRLAQADILLYHRPAHRPDSVHLDILVRSSFAEYALRWLHDAGLEYDITVAPAPDQIPDPPTIEASGADS